LKILHIDRLFNCDMSYRVLVDKIFNLVTDGPKTFDLRNV
jgi:hypothetical protein